MEFLAGQPRPGQSRFASPPSKGPFDLVEPRWRMDLNDEVALGLAPAHWSLSSQMNDPRPNGKCIFDAVYRGSPMGRARSANGIIWDPRSMTSPVGTRQ